MSYVVLARKYRPRSFTEMVGQEHVVQALSNALTQQRLHHAYLFTGTRGVGKTTVSRILAKSLNCTGVDGHGGITAQPCGVCDACRDIDAGRYVDYVELDAASNRGVDEISQLLDQAVYKPVMGRFKVYMIDEVHMLSSTAFNAMLKTLEEPPEYLKFVLATTDPQKVPVTVLSRCLQFNLRPMAAETVFEHLGQVLAAEQVPAEPGALRLISRAAHGSMRDALSLTDQAIAYAGGQLDEAQVRQMLGAVDRSHVVRMVEAVAAQDGAALVRCVDDLRGLGLSAVGALEELATLAQQMAVLQVVPESADPADPDTPQLQRLTPLLAPDELQLLYSIALHGRAELALAPDEYSGLVMVLLRLLAFSPGSAPKPAPERREPTPAATPPRRDLLRPTAAVSSVTPARPAPAMAPRAVAEPAPVPAPVPVPVPASVAVPAPMAQIASEPESGGSSVPPWEELLESWEMPALAPVVAPAIAPVAPPVVAVAAAAVVAAAEIVIPTPASVSIPGDAVPQDRWGVVCQQLFERGAVTGLVRELAWQAQCVDFDDAAGRWQLRVERESLRQSSHRERLQTALTELLGQPQRLEIEAGAVSDSAARRDAATRLRVQREAEALMQGDPQILQLLAHFPGSRIVPGSIRPR